LRELYWKFHGANEIAEHIASAKVRVLEALQDLARCCMILCWHGPPMVMNAYARAQMYMVYYVDRHALNYKRL